MKVAIIINEAAGAVDGKAADDWLSNLPSLCAEVGLEAKIHSVPSDKLIEVARTASKSDVDAVVATGGDGTISTVAGVLCGTDMPMGVLPLGTLNHFAKDLGLPMDLKGALQVIAGGHTRAIDVGEVNGHVFINNSSIGGYPEAVRERDEQREHKGRRKWSAMFLAALQVFRRYPLMHVQLELDGRPSVRTTPFVFVGNNEYKMSFFTYSSRSSIDQGRLCVYTADCRNRLGFLWLVWLFLINRLEQAENFRSSTVQELWVKTHKKNLRVATDGEVIRLETPLHYRSRPGVLKVLVPEPAVTAKTT